MPIVLVNLPKLRLNLRNLYKILRLPMFKVKSNHIKDFPFEAYAQLTTPTDLMEQAQVHRLSNYNSWMLPQIAAYYGGWKTVTVGDQVDVKATARANMNTSWDIGLWRVVTQLKRSALVQSQNLSDYVNYSAVVPIVLMGLKRYQNIGYSRWNLTPTDTLVEPKLLEAMMFRDEKILNLSRDELLTIRELGLTVKSGDRAGTQNKPTHQWCLRGIGLTALGKVPTLVSTMLTQIWVCHPSLRTHYMILDPRSWDTLPEPLISAEIFDKTEKAPRNYPSKTTTPLPWE